MTFEDYRKELLNDILTTAEENEGLFDNLEDFEDYLWTCDSVTGNGSGSYTCNSKQAEENLGDLIFSNELLEMFKEFGFERVPLEEGAEHIDVSIRCFLLNEVIYTNDEEIKKALKIED